MNAVVKHEELQTLPAGTVSTPTPGDLLRLAVDRGADLEKLERLMDLQERWEATNARKAYVAAMARFKATPLTITKDKHVRFQTQKGVTEYDHATIGNVTAQICAALGQHGFSHRWDTEQQDGGRIAVTCVITHDLGHSESTTLKASPDDSGGKNNIQAIASAVTYLQRYTLLAATGMATSDQQDDDGRAAEPIDDPAESAEFADWRAAIEAAATKADIAQIWKDMTPDIRRVMAAKIKARKQELPE